MEPPLFKNFGVYVWREDRSTPQKLQVTVEAPAGATFSDLTIKNLHDAIQKALATSSGAGSTDRDVRDMGLACEQFIRYDGDGGVWRIIANDDIVQYEEGDVIEFDTLFAESNRWFLSETDRLKAVDLRSVDDKVIVHAYIASSRPLAVAVVDLWKVSGCVNSSS